MREAGEDIGEAMDREEGSSEQRPIITTLLT